MTRRWGIEVPVNALLYEEVSHSCLVQAFQVFPKFSFCALEVGPIITDDFGRLASPAYEPSYSAFMNESVSNEFATSRWTALHFRQVNKHP